MSINETGVLRSWRWTRTYTILHHTSTFSSANSQFFNDVSLVVEPGNELVLTFTPTPEPEQILLVTAIRINCLLFAPSRCESGPRTGNPPCEWDVLWRNRFDS